MILIITSSLIEVIIHNKVSKRNSILLYFVGEIPMLLKQVNVETSCAKMSDSQGNNFDGHEAVL